MIASPCKDRKRKTSYNESFSSKKEHQPSRLLPQQVTEVSSPSSSTADYKKGSSYAELMKMKTKNNVSHKSVSPLAKMIPGDKNADIQKIFSDKEQVSIQQETYNIDNDKTKPRSSQDAASKIWQIFNQESLLTNSSRKNSDKIDTNNRDKDSFASISGVVSCFAAVDQSDIPLPRQPLSPFLRSVLNELPLKNSQSTSSEGGSTHSIQNQEAQQIPITLPSPTKHDKKLESFSNDSPLKHFNNSLKPSMQGQQLSSNSSAPSNPLQSQPQQPSKKVRFGFTHKTTDEQTQIDMTIAQKIMQKESTQAFKRSMEELFKLKDKSTMPAETREYEELISLMRMEQQIISNDINYLIQQCNKYKQLIDQRNKPNNSKPQESMIPCISTTSFKKMISFLESTHHPTKALIDLQSASDQEIEELLPSIKDKDGLIQTQRNAIARLISSLKLRNTLLSQDYNYV